MSNTDIFCLKLYNHEKASKQQLCRDIRRNPNQWRTSRMNSPAVNVTPCDISQKPTDGNAEETFRDLSFNMN